MPRNTEGGEASMLYYLRALTTTAALPWSVCPYTANKGHDHECPGLAEARETNPLTFSLASISWLYEREDIKRRLLQHRRLMTFSTGMVTVRFLLPCTSATASVLQCDPTDQEQCWPCPLEPAFSRVECCVLSDRDSYTMEGEFFRLPSGSHPDPVPEGAHAMGIVGFSDVFRTQHGYVGGYILKNSWWDGLPPAPSWKKARGSHTIAYFMQQVSSADEAKTCPNAHSPQVWFRCDTVLTCRSNKTAVYAKAANQPLHLECVDESPFLKGFCEKGEGLFIKSIKPWGGGLSTACFVRDQAGAVEDEGEGQIIVNRRQLAAEKRSPSTICSPPVPLDDLALVVAPIEAERFKNDPELCGHYFFPYELAEDINAANGGFEVSDMDVRWQASAYAANKKRNSHLDYSLVERDTHTQGHVHKNVPFLDQDVM